MNLAVSADSSFSRWSLFGHRQAWRWAEEVIARVGIRTSGPAQSLRTPEERLRKQFDAPEIFSPICHRNLRVLSPAAPSTG